MAALEIVVGVARIPYRRTKGILANPTTFHVSFAAAALGNLSQ